MGTLYRNGVPYIGSGGAGGVEVTQAEYDSLPESEKLNGSIYFITDGSVSYPTASQMRYDNTESGIPSTSVQGAIDELKIDVDDLNNGLLKSAVADATGTVTTSATGTANITAIVPNNSVPVLAVATNDSAFCTIMYNINNTYWIRAVDWSGNALANKSLTIHVFGIKTASIINW